MVRTWFLAMGCFLGTTAAAPAQTAAWQFKTKTGQELLYNVELITSSTEVIGGAKTSTTTKLNLVKRWQDLGPQDGKPGTRLALSMTSMRMETTKANGEVMLFDSANLDKSTPEMREQLSKFVGSTLAVIRLDPSGKVLEVVESKHGPASRFDNELPFLVQLPNAIPKPGQSWVRPYRITLEPPQGAGEKYEAGQRCVCKAIADGKATLGLTTTIKNLPESLLDQVPLLHQQQEGEVIYDIEAGRLDRAQLKIDKDLKDHQGKGSSYRFESLYSMQYAGEK